MKAYSKVIHAEKRFGKKAPRRTESRGPLKTLYVADLKKSGIDLKTAKVLGWKLRKSESLWAALHPNRAARVSSDFSASGYTMPFFRCDGTRIPFIRARKLKGHWSDRDDGTQRYSQPGNTIPHLYIPQPIMDLPEPDPITGKIKLKGELVIVEGEKKAVKGNLCGIRTVALSGVWNFGSTKHDLPLVEEFKAFDLSETDVVVNFDTDTFENDQVEAALKRFMYVIRAELQPRSVKRVRLTGELMGGKLALDDWLANFKTPGRALAAWNTLERREDRAAECFAIYDAEVVYVLKEKKYYDIAVQEYFPSQRALFEQYSLGAKVIGTDGKKMTFPIQVWNETRSNRSIVHDIQYVPGKPARFSPNTGDKYESLNLWRPPAIEPAKKVDLKALAPFLEYFNHFTASVDEDAKRWFMQWLAYPIQNKGAKLMSAVLAVSSQTGVGKGFLYNSTLRRLYGRANSVQIDGSTLGIRFNNYVMTQMLHIDEVHMPAYREQAAVMARLKMLITEPEVSFEDKHIKRRSVPNYANMYLTSNFPNDALRLDEDDRRFFVISVSPSKEWPASRFKELDDWLEDGGIEQVLAYLLAYDCSKFNPFERPPMTSAKQRMLERKDGAFGDLVRTLIDSPDDVLTIAGDGKRSRCELYTPQRLVEALLKYAHEKHIRYKGEISKHSISTGLKKLPKRRIHVMTTDGPTHVTLYALFNKKHWKNKKLKKAEWLKHWTKFNKPPTTYATMKRSKNV